MAGLQRICKLYGAMVIQGKRYVWDYARDIAVLESDMTDEQRNESERTKWMEVKKRFHGEKPVQNPVENNTP
jgi:hypothetical protein